MVLEQLVHLLSEQYACDPQDIDIRARLDDLNLSNDDRSELMLLLEELYGVPVPSETLDGFETLEDIVEYIEDRL